jgi:hypothetical protein
MVWKELKDNFSSHFIPVSVMKLKRKEFLSLKQGQMTVTEYRDKFIQLSKYASRSVESDKKKREYFIKGLNEDLQSILSLNEYSSLQHVTDKAIELESKLQEIIYKKRKIEFLEQRDNNSHLYHLSQAPNYPEDEYEDPPHNRRNIKVELVSTAKLIDILLVGALRNVLIDKKKAQLSGILPGYSCKEGRRRTPTRIPL